MKHYLLLAAVLVVCVAVVLTFGTPIEARP